MKHHFVATVLLACLADCLLGQVAAPDRLKPTTNPAGKPLAALLDTYPSGGAQPEGVDPITDKQRLDIARVQRDLLLADSTMKEAVEQFNSAKTEAEKLQKSLAEKVQEAGKSCGVGRSFDTAKLLCIAAAPGKGRP